MRLWATLAVTTLCLACVVPVESAPRSKKTTRPADPSELAALGEQARAIAKVHCGKCHANDDSDGIEGALKVFDLRQKAWFSGLDAEQLEGARGRMDDKASDGDRKRFAKFVEAAKSALGATVE